MKFSIHMDLIQLWRRLTVPRRKPEGGGPMPPTITLEPFMTLFLLLLVSKGKNHGIRSFIHPHKDTGCLLLLAPQKKGGDNETDCAPNNLYFRFSGIDR